MKINEINSISSKNKRPAEAIKLKIKNNTECTGFFTVITKAEDTIAKIEKETNKISSDMYNI